jgi:hypothetical protein
MSIFIRDSEPDVLILPGVTLNDLVSIDQLLGSSNEEEEKTPREKPKPSKLPEEFYDLETWPLSTNLKCCFCRLRYTTIPVSMPTGIIKDDMGKKGYKVQYNYCSFLCCIKAISNIKETFMREFRLAMLEKMFKCYYKVNVQIQSLKEGPDVDTLIDYGGDETPQGFRKKINKIMNKTLAGAQNIDPAMYILQPLDNE